uniref:ADF-H domain-containing protein n=1 Tax=Romanomermis culicivorax TaxID=13658 RepID=A0A915I3K8_ROMCU
MSSGVAVNPDCQTTFLQMAENKKEYRYIVFKIEEKEIVVEKKVSNEEMQCHGKVDDYATNSKISYEEFIDDIKELTDDLSDCRYAVFDFKFTGQREGAGQSKMDKIIFLQICPDRAPVKRKMVYASSASAIKTALGTGKMLALQISEESEMSHSDLLRKLSDKYSDKSIN